MVFRIPYLEVNGPSGTNLVPIWGTALLNVKVVSYLDFMMDEATLTFSNKPPYKVSPPEGTKFNIRIGWSKTSAVDKGTFALQRIHLSGTPAQGERVAYICRAGIFDEGLNKVDSQHFGQDTGDTTLGDVFRKLFAGTGKSVEVAPEIDGKPIPGGYMLRQNQTAADAATDLAQNNRAVWKVAGDKIIVLALDAGQSVTGKGLGSIAIDHASCYEYDVEIEPRFSYSSVGGDVVRPRQGPHPAGEHARRGRGRRPRRLAPPRRQPGRGQGPGRRLRGRARPRGVHRPLRGPRRPDGLGRRLRDPGGLPRPDRRGEAPVRDPHRRGRSGEGMDHHRRGQAGAELTPASAAR